MAENNPTPPSGQPFERRTVETPILDSQLPKQEAGGLKAFYRANKMYFWAILAGVIIIAVLSYLAFRKTPPAAPGEAKVDISVDVPGQVPSGGEAVYKITVQNNDTQKLVGMELELAYPDGIAYENSTPNAENLSGTLFAVPDLIPGQNAAVFVKTKVSGNVNDQKTLNIKLHYKYSNFNSEFAKSQDSTVTLTASSVLVELDGPATTNNAQLIVYTVKYQNNSDADIQNARVKMNYPDGFKFASATPPPDLGADTWDVGTLAKGGSGTIQIQGTFASANPGETKTATADFLVLDATGQANVQNSSVPLNTSISSLPLLVSQSLQGNNSSGVVNPGDTLTVNVTYQNNAATAASGVNIQATVNSKAVDLSSLRAEGGQINNNTIIWNAAGVPQLQSLSPNQSGSLSFSFKLKNPAVTDASKNLAVVSDIQMQSNEYSSPFPGNELNLKVSSPAAVNTGLTFVSGQLPPQVGRATVYDIKFSLVNSSNDFSNGVLTAYLPLAGGGFNSSSVTAAEAGNVQFDAASGKLTWNFGSLPAYSGKFNQARVLEFQVTLNPSASQAGQSPTLVKNIGLSATDLFTGQNVSLSARDLTTSSLQGQSGYGVGQVQP